MQGIILIPDTSVIIEGIPSKRISSGEINPKAVVVHNAVVDELEHMANHGQETGYLGLEEIKRLRELCESRGIPFSTKGPQPGQFEIDHAKDGAIDDMIRQLTRAEQGMLLTADRVQHLVAQAEGIPVHYVQFDVATKEGTALDDFFTPETMSVHLKEDAKSFRKVGRPGEWQFEELPGILTRGQVIGIAKSLVEQAGARKDSYIEVERRGSTVLQLGRYRTVIAKPPFASGWEITAVRPVRQLTLDEYPLSQKLRERLSGKAEGVLIAGAPGSGKSTFVQALAAKYVEQQRIVKTIEAPRDLIVPKEVTQYSLSHASAEEIRDVLLLNRPDYTIFDEMRNTDHFKLYSDLRLSGVGMVGVVHATAAVDAIQRFLGRIELGVIPHVVDTVVFIKAGQPQKVYSITMQVKVPAGMTEADLARPIVCIYDFESEKLEFEVYTYGEQTVVVPVSGENAESPLLKLAAQSVKDFFYRYADKVDVQMPSASKAIVSVPKEAIAAIIGQGGKNIQSIEEQLGISIDIVERGKHGGHDRGEPERATRAGHSVPNKPSIPYELTIDKKQVLMELTRQYAGGDFELFDGARYLLSITANKKAQIKFGRDTPQASTVMHAAKHGNLALYEA